MTPKLRTCLMFNGKAEEAARFYVSVFEDSAVETVSRPTGDGTALAVEFTLAGVPYLALNAPVDVPFSHATSISVLTEDQAETDALWHTLSEGGSEGRCGWLTDRYGFAWQIVPRTLPAMTMADDAAAARRAHSAMMGMTKIDIATLQRAFYGEEIPA